MDRGWTNEHHEDVDPAEHIALLEVIARRWPDLEDECDDVIDKIEAAREWWNREGSHLHDMRMRELAAERRDEYEAEMNHAYVPEADEIPPVTNEKRV